MKVRYWIIFVVVIAVVFGVVFFVRTKQIDNEQLPLTEKQISELDEQSIAEITITVNGSVYRSVAELSADLKKKNTPVETLTDTKIKCDVTYSNGKTDKHLDGYVTKGDSDRVEMRGSVVHIIVAVG